MTLAQEESNYNAIFGDSSCQQDYKADLDEVENAISECMWILQDAIERKDQNEIKYWRKLLQENKMQRLEILNT